MLTAYGCTIATSAAIALVYRGIMLWLPFIAGALCLSQTDFFKDKKSLILRLRRLCHNRYLILIHKELCLPSAS